MTTRFSGSGTLLAVAAPFLLLGKPAGTDGVSGQGHAERIAFEWFAENRDAVLSASTGYARGEDRVYCVGRAKSDPAHGTSVGEGKARAMATARLFDFVRDSSPWPADASAEDRALSWALLLSETPLAIDGISAERIFSAQPGEGLYLVVVAYPAEAALAARPGAGTLAAALDRLRALREEVERERAAPQTDPAGPVPAETGPDEPASAEPVPAKPAPAATRLDALRQNLLQWTEPRGLFETNGIIVNETMSDSLL